MKTHCHLINARISSTECVSSGDVSAQLLLYASGTNAKLIRTLETIHICAFIRKICIVCVCVQVEYHIEGVYSYRRLDDSKLLLSNSGGCRHRTITFWKKINNTVVRAHFTYYDCALPTYF